MKLAPTAFSFAVLLCLAGHCAVFGAEDFWPSNEWSRVMPAEVGLEKGKLCVTSTSPSVFIRGFSS